MRNLLLGSTALIVLEALAPSMARAQTKSDSAELQEIIVTATRRSESVQSIPSNITAVSGARLEQSGVSDIGGVVRLVPGLSLFDEGARVSGNRNNFNLRGLNANAATNNDDNPSLIQESVSTYLGETPVFFPLKLVDINRVEVLRGPQGTLYGAGSVGGTIRFIPNNPDFSGFYGEATVEGSLTDHSDDTGYQGMVLLNAPVSDNVAVRVVGGYEYDSGYIDAVNLVQQTGTTRHPGAPVLADPNDFLGSGVVRGPVVKDHNDATTTFFRGAVRYEPSDQLNLQLNYAYQKVEANGRSEDNPYYGSGEEYVSYRAYTDPQDSEINLVDADVEVDLGFARLTSASAYSEIKVDSVSDSSGYLRTNLASYYFGFPRLYAPLTRHQKVNTVSQEIRLVSPGGGRVDWTLGAFYLKRDTKFSLYQPMEGISEYTNLLLGLSPQVDFTDILAEGGRDDTFEDLALFGELTYHVTDKLSVTGGARVFRDKTKGTAGIPLPFASRTTSYFYGINPLDDYLLGGWEPYERTSKDQIFKANVAYDVSDDLLFYATWAQGFRPGGANALPKIDPFGNDNSAILTYDPDTATNYEIGAKGRLFGKLSYTATLYRVDWKDFQTTLYSAFGQNYVANVPSARSQGLELEALGQLTDRLSASFGYAYTDAKTTADFDYVQGDPTTLIPSGTALPASTKHTLSGALDYVAPLPGDAGELTFHVDASYRGKSTTDYKDLPTALGDNYLQLKGFTVVGASVTWRRDKVALTLFGNNLLNVRGTTYGYSKDTLGAEDQLVGVIRPLTVGLRLKLGF
ncbi:TonB-dependent receptor [Phenylobacterium sp.]|uniref:TonB-dependent receptor n=1 Tax=Phenylobacterium sp. TaxID=1871053 RepID=UPI0035B4D357